MKKLSTLKSQLSTRKGFTLIELLIVIVIIATLAVTVFVAINPAQRFKDARDAKRTSDVQTNLTAIQQYIVDNKGAYPPGLAAGTPITQLGSPAGTGCSGAVGICAIAVAQDTCLDLSIPLAKYLKSQTIDPNGGTAAKTKYAVGVDANGIVTVTACGTEGATAISASR